MNRFMVNLSALLAVSCTATSLFIGVEMAYAKDGRRSEQGGGRLKGNSYLVDLLFSCKAPVYGGGKCQENFRLEVASRSAGGKKNSHGGGKLQDNSRLEVALRNTTLEVTAQKLLRNSLTNLAGKPEDKGGSGRSGGGTRLKQSLEAREWLGSVAQEMPSQTLLVLARKPGSIGGGQK